MQNHTLSMVNRNPPNGVSGGRTNTRSCRYFLVFSFLLSWRVFSFELHAKIEERGLQLISIFKVYSQEHLEVQGAAHQGLEGGDDAQRDANNNLLQVVDLLHDSEKTKGP